MPESPPDSLEPGGPELVQRGCLGEDQDVTARSAASGARNARHARRMGELTRGCCGLWRRLRGGTRGHWQERQAPAERMLRNSRTWIHHALKSVSDSARRACGQIPESRGCRAARRGR
eukprot:627131-Rhodomonas_salina.3